MKACLAMGVWSRNRRKRWIYPDERQGARVVRKGLLNGGHWHYYRQGNYIT